MVQPAQVPEASGALNFVRMLGGTIGVNLTAILITARTSHHFEESRAALQNALLNSTQKIEALESVYQDVFLITAGVFSISLLFALYLARSSKTNNA